ncbi:DeoR/GlpR family DNA-binding transcription regulator [Cohnella massiliensis]|uniref:DeoR/GlpR family DNA-binding transcription regulator n=1 Tax=Cohnella massiliensis TaxID=1816691 RepID=UPI0009BA5617|nr:DeoR/GlpR family DNA-binding transcription regulator [Cohnella massiliensis]
MPNSRQEQLIRCLGEKSPLSVEELSVLLSVSEATVRRDLVELEDKGLIVRQRGGASLPGLGVEPLFNQRQKLNRDWKRKIAQHAAEQIAEGEVIALDVGTTTAELAKELLKKANLTIFTYSLQVASILSRSRHKVYIVGGHFRMSEMSMVGSIALSTIKQFNFDRFYLGLAGLSKFQGPTDFSLEEVEIKRALIERSKQVIALADPSKFGVSSLVKVCEFNEIDEIVTEESGRKAAEELEFAGKITIV